VQTLSIKNRLTRVLSDFLVAICKNLYSFVFSFFVWSVVAFDALDEKKRPVGRCSVAVLYLFVAP
jgi:hypothetical protein